MNVGWYIAYLLACFLNGYMCAKHGFNIDQWQFWVWTGIVALSFIAGANYRKED